MPLSEQFERYSDPYEVLITRLAERIKSRIWTKLPVKVTKIWPDGQHVDLEILVQGRVRVPGPNGWVWKDVPYPPLVQVPVKFPSGGGYTLTFPIKENNEGTVAFSARDITNWWLQGEQQGPQPQLAQNGQGSYRTHSLSDGFFEMGGRSQPNLLQNVSTTDTQLRSDDGTQYITFGPAGVTIKTQNGTFVFDSNGNFTANGNVTAGQGTADSVKLQTHTHPDPQGGHTGAPDPGT